MSSVMMRIEMKSMVTSLVCGAVPHPHATTNTGQKQSGIRVIFLPMARPTAHVLTLLELLQSGGTRTAAELAGRLPAARRGLLAARAALAVGDHHL